MRINNNMMAMNTHRQLGTANAQGAKSMEKLSSGMRINRAGDDAAGLAISEKMRGQIRGLNQASSNAQDGISLIQTAEGALNETHAILQRMRELAVQSSTDTNTLDDRKEIQKEINQLTSEVNRIGNTTEFNKMQLINGDRQNTLEVTGMNFVGGTDTKTNAGSTGFDVKLLDGANALSAGSHELEITVDRNTRTTQTEATLRADFDGTSTGAAKGVVFKDNKIAGDASTTADTWTLTYDATNENFKLTNAASGDGSVEDVIAVGEAYNNHGLSFTIDDVGTIANGETLVFETTVGADTIGTKQVGWTANGTTTQPANVNVTITDAQEASGAAGGTVTAEWTGANAIKVTLTAKDGTTIISDDIVDGSGTYTNHGITIDFSEAATADHVGAKFEFAIAEDTYTVKASLDGGAAVELSADYDGTSATITDFAGISGLELNSAGALAAGTFTFDSEQTVTGADSSLQFQVGANENQAMNLSISDMRGEALGITGTGAGYTADNTVTDGTNASEVEKALDVLSHDAAKNAITVFDEAINKVSSERSKLGASQNRLEYTIKNLDTSSENLQSAESRIRDVDMAKEMMEQTKQNILAQASTAMLANANSAPQSVLQLLG